MDYNDRPRLSVIILSLFMAAMLAMLAYHMPGDTSAKAIVKFVVIITAASFAAYGLANLIVWAVSEWIELKAEWSKARYPVIMAQALGKLSPDAIGVLSRSTVIEVLGMATDDLTITWRIKSTPVDVDWTFAQEFVEVSRAYYPKLAPVGRAYEIIPDHRNAERQAQALTNLLVQTGLAVPAVGNQAATLVCEWEDLAVKFGLD